MTFAGFPSSGKATAIPNVFFSDVLPRLSGDPVALGVVLYAFKVLLRKKGSPRYLTAAELATEPALATYIGAGADAPSAITAGLRRAVELGVLLPLQVERDGTTGVLFFLNAPADKRGLEAVRTGAVDLGRVVDEAAAVPNVPSGIFALYEALVGTLSPLVTDELAEAERLYPADWLEAAFREAAVQNARSWRYVSRILERWATEGPDHAKIGRDSAEADRYFSGKYGSILKQRLER